MNQQSKPPAVPASQLPADRPGKAAFTLIEISIVLVIIGLIVGGVLVGQNLINAAAVRAQINQMLTRGGAIAVQQRVTAFWVRNFGAGGRQSLLVCGNMADLRQSTGRAWLRGESERFTFLRRGRTWAGQVSISCGDTRETPRAAISPTFASKYRFSVNRECVENFEVRNIWLLGRVSRRRPFG